MKPSESRAPSAAAAPLHRPWVLAEDLIVQPPQALPKQILDELGEFDGRLDGVAMARPGARTPTQWIDRDTAKLLNYFRVPCSIQQAIGAYSRAQGQPAEQVLSEALPVLDRLCASQVLVRPGTAAASPLTPTCEAGSSLDRFTDLEAVQILSDSEVYRARDTAGERVAIKLARPESVLELNSLFEREARILKHLKGEVAPRLISSGGWQGRPYLVLEWIAGASIDRAAAAIRRPSARPKQLELARRLVRAYLRLENRGILHADIHPRNLLVDSKGDVRVIDFALSHARRLASISPPPRGAVAYFVEPEYATSQLREEPRPAATPASEQFSLAAVIFHLMTGALHLPRTSDLRRWWRRLAETPSSTFADVGVEPWPDLEAVLRRALAKQPEARFPTLADFHHALTTVKAPTERASGARSSVARSLKMADDRNIVQQLLPGGTIFEDGLLEAPSASVNCGATGIAFGLIDRLDQLAGCVESTDHGLRLPACLGRNTDDVPQLYPVGWCNGAAGFVFLFTLAHQLLRRPQYLEIAKGLGSTVAWAKTNNPTLCCGLAGQAYALLNLYRHTEDLDWLRQAEEYTARMQPLNLPLPSYVHSLYQGDLGIALLDHDLQDPDRSAMPFFESEGWSALATCAPKP